MFKFEKIKFKFIDQPNKRILVSRGKEQFIKTGQMRLLDQKYNMIYNFLCEKFKNHDLIKVCKSLTTFSIYVCISVPHAKRTYSIRISNHVPEEYKRGNKRIIHNYMVKMNSFVNLYSLYIDICKIYKEFIKETTVNKDKLDNLYYTYSSMRLIKKTYPHKNIWIIRDMLIDNLDKVV